MHKPNGRCYMSEHVNTPHKNQTNGLEKWLDDAYKKFPLQLPEGARKWLTDNAWWLVLIGGVLMLWGTWAFWQAGHYVSDLARSVGVDTSQDLGFMWYIALLAMLLQAVLYLIAVPKLKNHQKSGWNLVFYASLVSVVMGLIYIFVPNYAGNIVGVILGAAISWFFLFQVRSKFAK